jgi:Glycosyltransferase family 9 (heptosyltransferase)
VSKAALDYLRSTLLERHRVYQYVPPRYNKAEKVDHVPVRATGGIGDLVISIGVAEAIRDRCGKVVLYSKWPEISSLFTDLPGRHEKKLLGRGVPALINLNSIAVFQFAENFEGFENPGFGDLYVANKHFLTQGMWPEIADHHPHIDQFLGRESAKLGLFRESLPYASLGLEYKPFKRRLALHRPLPYDYITVHDGHDVNNDHKGRSTKNWDMEAWKAFLRCFQARFPEIKVVQLGGPNSRRIPGVDVDRVGMLGFKDSLAFLAHARLHVDGDSGLVHASRTLGTRSVVIFGPTPPSYFGYPENENIAPNFCGGCWWLKKNWMANCPVGYERVECMDSITPMEVLNRVKRILNVEG